MSNVIVTVDTRRIQSLGAEFDQVAHVSMLRLVELGRRYVSEEAPERTGRLKGKRSNLGSITGDVRKEGEAWVGEINVSAIRERTNAAEATVHYPSGKTKRVRLRAQKAFDYAEVVATGRPRLTAPRQAKAFLVPVQSAPSNQAYLESGGQIYVMRRQIGEQKPNDYPGRALARLAQKAEGVISAVIDKVANA